MRSIDQTVPLFFTDLHRKCLAAILRTIADYYGERMVSLVVFGSYARREPRFDSDLDLLIVLKSGSWSRLSERTEEFVTNVEQPCDEGLQLLFEEGISMELSPLILTRDEAQNFLPLYLDMVSNSLIIEDHEGFFAGVIEKVKQQMARWGSERINVSGHWLWEIRPGLKWDEVLSYDE
jgi:predicted nucleotidyltransferase